MKKYLKVNSVEVVEEGVSKLTYKGRDGKFHDAAPGVEPTPHPTPATATPEYLIKISSQGSTMYKNPFSDNEELTTEELFHELTENINAIVYMVYGTESDMDICRIDSVTRASTIEEQNPDNEAFAIIRGSGSYAGLEKTSFFTLRYEQGDGTAYEYHIEATKEH